MKKIIYITVSIILFSGIFWFSSKDADTSSKQSDEVIVTMKIMTKEEMINEPAKASNYRFIVRKSAHFTIYTLLGIFIYLAVKEFMGSGFNAAVIGILLTLLCASFDEFHQSFIPGRSMEFRDILIDTLGASIGIIIIIRLGLIFVKKNRYDNIYYYGTHRYKN